MLTKNRYIDQRNIIESPETNPNIYGQLLLLSCFSPVRLLATPWTAAYDAPPSMGFSRQEYWGGVPLPSPYGQLIYCKKKKKSKNIQWVKYIWFNKWFGEIFTTLYKIRTFSHTIHKINSKWMKVLDMRLEIIKLLEKIAA